MQTRLIATALLLLGSALPALAQNSTEFFGGYSYTRMEGGGLNGWTAALAVPVGGSTSLVFEGGGHYSSITVPLFDGSGGTFSANANIHSFRAGPRYSVRTANDIVTPFIQALAGYGRVSADAGYSDSFAQLLGFDPGSVDVSGNGLSMAFGGGLDVRTGGITFRVLQADYHILRSGNGSIDGPRLSFGIVLTSR